MLSPAFRQFISGTDIRGVASEGVPEEPINLTDENIDRFSSAFCLWLSRKTGRDCGRLSVSVGHDSRLSAGRISSVVIRRLRDSGVRVLDCGLCTTPAMFMTTRELNCDGSVQITASHHPFHRNGLKFFTKEGGLSGEDILAILALVEEGACPVQGQGNVELIDFLARYAQSLRCQIIEGIHAGDKPLQGFHIVVDAGNGAGGFYATQVLAPLGADISGSQFLEPDGRFPNHIPNPENQEAMNSVSRAVVEAGADLGVIFDTDVDRAGCVDRDGKEINRNRLVALAAAIALEDCPGGTIVTDSVTSAGLKTYIENTLGGKHYRFKRGYKNVIDEAVRLNNAGSPAPLAIETSGHAAFACHYFLDDGAYLATRLIIKAAMLKREGRALSDLIRALPEPAEETELRLPITETDFQAAGERIIAGLEQYARDHCWAVADDNREGLRVSFGTGEGDGWFLLRMSVHDPILPLNAESDVSGGMKKIVGALYGYLQACKGIDLSPVTAFLEKP